MKVFYLIVFNYIYLLTLTAQPLKYDYNWIIGENTLYYCLLNFETLTPKVLTKNSFIIPFDDCNISMSDVEGKLIFFSNGLQVCNKNFKIMEGGERINPSSFLDPYLETGAPSNIVMSIPYNNVFWLIHQDSDYESMPTPKIFSKTLYYSIVDMSYNSGLGKVLKPNTILRKNLFSSGYLTAAKHGNGRDWWIPVLGDGSNTIFVFKLNENGVSFSHVQGIGSTAYNLFGQVVFSPDGTKYAKVDASHYHIPTFVDLMDFDRCSGKFSNHNKIILEDSLTKLTVCGVAISPNSRFLYVSYQFYVFQYDLWASDIAASKDTVAVYDGFTDPASLNWPTYFYTMQIGPDGKIYINTANYATTYLHVIDQPDEKGKACNVLQHKIKLTASNSFTMPNHPNYRLGPLKGSPCDSLTSSIEIKADYHIKVFPNPATTELKIDITLPQYDPQTPTEIHLISAAGAIVKTYIMPDYAYLATLDISDVDSGFYEVQLRQRGKTMAVEKVVVVR